MKLDIVLFLFWAFVTSDSDSRSVIKIRDLNQHPKDDHDQDEACRSIDEADQAALQAIQGATEGILKVIDMMDVDSRPTGPVSAFIKIPKSSDVDETGEPGKTLQEAIAEQINQEGFTISYNDKLSLEAIKVAAEEIQTQLLHLDLAERLKIPVKTKRGQSAKETVNTPLKRNVFLRRNVRDNQNTTIPATKPPVSKDNPKTTIRTTKPPVSVEVKSPLPAETTCENIQDDMDNINEVVQALHTEINAIGRKMREEYIDDSNLARTDIKSISDNLKKLQGMISVTNYTLLAELSKGYEEQRTAQERFDKELKAIKEMMLKIYLTSFDRNADKLSNLEGNRIAKSVDRDTYEDKENNNVYTSDGLDYDDEF